MPHAVDRRSPAALADGLGGEECPEDVIAGSFVHAAAGAGDFQDEPQNQAILGGSRSFCYSRNAWRNRRIPQILNPHSSAGSA